jgi:hypothetical protein
MTTATYTIDGTRHTITDTAEGCFAQLDILLSIFGARFRFHRTQLTGRGNDEGKSEATEQAPHAVAL